MKTKAKNGWIRDGKRGAKSTFSRGGEAAGNNEKAIKSITNRTVEDRGREKEKTTTRTTMICKRCDDTELRDVIIKWNFVVFIFMITDRLL